MLGSSSGCESGWTLYLDQSVSSPSCFRDSNGFETRRISKDSWDQNLVHQEDDEEDDLSMISDASSGPRNISEEDSAKKINIVGLKKQNKREKTRRDYEKINSVLDDTASSPFYNFPHMLHKSVTGNKIEQNFPESTLDYSQGFSATQFQDKTAFQEQYDYLHMDVVESDMTLDRRCLKGFNFDLTDRQCLKVPFVALLYSESDRLIGAVNTGPNTNTP